MTTTYTVKPHIGYANSYQQTIIPSSALITLETSQLYHGYIKGCSQPVAHVTLQVNSFNARDYQHLQPLLTYCFTNYSITFNAIQSIDDLLKALGDAVCALQKIAGLPIFDSVQISPVAEGKGRYSLWIPMLYDACFSPALSFALHLLNQHAKTIPNQALTDNMKLLISQFHTYAPTRSNSWRLLEEAHRLSIPWMPLSQNTFQLGYGRLSRWFDSTFTDKTPLVSAELAKNKIDTHTLLRSAGLPIPLQRIARTEAEAISLANNIGYPVVIKPINQDLGIGVFSHLVSDLGVRKAYQQARQYSPNVILEKHIEGKDYRLLVLNGELIWAIERIPAGVIGNGVHTIQELVHEINKNPERGTDGRTTLSQIIITDDSIDFLREQGFSVTTIPKEGQFIAVNRIANISAGGTPIGVFDKVHPDNKRLAETAAKLLRLDIAGIDFITADIQRSYLQTGGAIIEVNGQPQIGSVTAPHIFRELLSKLLPNQGRIPIIVVYSHSVDDTVIKQLQLNLSPNYPTIGVAKNNMAYLNNEQISDNASLFTAGKALLLNNTVDSLIYCMKPGESELPFDKFNTLLYDDDSLPIEESIIHACQGQIMSLESWADTSYVQWHYLKEQ